MSAVLLHKLLRKLLSVQELTSFLENWVIISIFFLWELFFPECNRDSSLLLAVNHVECTIVSFVLEDTVA